VLLYELLTGLTPFDQVRFKDVGYDEMRRIIREEEPPKPSTRFSTLGQEATMISSQRKGDPKRLSQLIRGELDWIVMKALEKDRNRRYETASALAADVQRFLHDEPVTACRPSAGYRFRKFTRRNRGPLTTAAIVTAALVLAIAVVAGSIGWVVRDREAQQEESTRQVKDLLSAARTLVAENQVVLARQKLADARNRIGDNPSLFGSVADGVQALDGELARFEHFLELVDMAREAEFPQAMPLNIQRVKAGVPAPVIQSSPPIRVPASAVPILIQALSCYGILAQDDWSARLAAGLLGPRQTARVRRLAYEQLLWLADDVARRRIDHHSGRKMSAQEAAEQALVYMRKAEAGAPATAALYRIRAACREALGQAEEARKDLALGQQAQETIALDHFLLGQAAYDAGNKEDAVRQCEAALRAEPTHFWSLHLLGYCLLNLGQQEHDFVSAAAAFTGCLLKRPEHVHTYLGRGNAYQKLQRQSEAAADYREAIRLRPDYAEAHNNLGSALYEQGKRAEAEAAYREALRLRPDFDRTHFNLGITLLEIGKHAEAEVQFRETLRLRPKFVEAHTGLGNALFEQGKHSAAEAAYWEGLRLRPDYPEGHIGLGNALSRQGKHAAAETEYREALRLRSDSPEAHNGLGFALDDQGKHVEAEEVFREALRLRPDYAVTHNNLAHALFHQSKYAEAEAACREALRLRPGFPEAHNSLGMFLFKQGKHADAEAAYREALRLRPDYHDAHNNLGNALAVQGKYADAVAAYREALRLQPDNAKTYFNMGLVLRQQGLFAEALAALKRGHELGSKQPDWRMPSAQWVRTTEHLVNLESKLPHILRGEAQPTGAAEQLELAELCEIKKLYAAAVRFYAEFFVAQPKLDVRADYRYNAACAAALAGCGQGNDAAQLDAAERARLRKQALNWLKADLAAWSQILDRAAMQKTLRHWQQDADFAGVRGDALAKLPEAAERLAWQQLWADVEKMLSKANDKAANDTKNSSD
jgi:tetratricopeptide (TPR) repeat protein